MFSAMGVGLERETECVSAKVAMHSPMVSHHKEKFLVLLQWKNAFENINKSMDGFQQGAPKVGILF